MGTIEWGEDLSEWVYSFAAESLTMMCEVSLEGNKSDSKSSIWSYLSRSKEWYANVIASCIPVNSAVSDDRQRDFSISFSITSCLIPRRIALLASSTLRNLSSFRTKSAMWPFPILIENKFSVSSSTRNISIFGFSRSHSVNSSAKERWARHWTNLSSMLGLRIPTMLIISLSLPSSDCTGCRTRLITSLGWHSENFSISERAVCTASRNRRGRSSFGFPDFSLEPGSPSTEVEREVRSGDDSSSPLRAVGVVPRGVVSDGESERATSTKLEPLSVW